MCSLSFYARTKPSLHSYQFFQEIFTNNEDVSLLLIHRLFLLRKAVSNQTKGAKLYLEFYNLRKSICRFATLVGLRSNFTKITKIKLNFIKKIVHESP